MDLEDTFAQKAAELMDQAPWKSLRESVEVINKAYPGLLRLDLDKVDFLNGAVSLRVTRTDTNDWLILQSDMGYDPSIRQTPSNNTIFLPKTLKSFWAIRSTGGLSSFDPEMPFKTVLEDLIPDLANRFQASLQAVGQAPAATA